MSDRPRRWRFRALAWTAGPGMVLALTAVGPGDVVSNAVAGASHGMSLLWVLALGLLLRYAWIRAAARYVLASGETLLEGFARLHKGFAWLVLLASIFALHLYGLYLVVLLGDSVHLLLPSTSPVLWSLALVAAGFILMARGGYDSVERTCQVLVAILGGALVVAAVLSKPDLSTVARGLVPTLPESNGGYRTILLVTAMIATQIGSTTNLGYAYFIREKGWRDVSALAEQRRDLLLGVCSIFVLGLLMQVAAAGSLGRIGAIPETMTDMARILGESQGTYGTVIFGVGLWAATFSTFVGGTAAVALIVSDGFHVVTKGVAKPAAAGTSRGPVYIATVAFGCVSPLYALWLESTPVLLTLIATSLMFLVVPLIAWGLLRITSDATIMGELANNRRENAVLALLIALATFLSLWNLWEMVTAWA